MCVYKTTMEAGVAVTQIDMDDEAPAEAMRLSGTSTKKETVNLALREYSAQRRRVESLEHFAEVARSGDYQGWRRLREAGKQQSR